MKKISLLILILLLCSTPTQATNVENFNKLMTAIHKNNSQKVLEALSEGVNLNYQSAGTGSTLLLEAIKYQQADIVTELLKHKPDVTLANYEGDTPLHAAAASAGKHKLCRILLRRRADMFALNIYGTTPHLIAQDNFKLRQLFQEFEDEQFLEKIKKRQAEKEEQSQPKRLRIKFKNEDLMDRSLPDDDLPPPLIPNYQNYQFSSDDES